MCFDVDNVRDCGPQIVLVLVVLPLLILCRYSF